MGTAGDARSFLTSGSAYDTFMGRYSAPLAALFADIGELVPGQRALDVGCGPGALTSVLADRLGVGAVSACDPSPPFVAECGERNPGVDVRSGSAEALPFESAEFDCVLAQLVLHFVDDPAAAMREFVRVTRPRGLIGACVWDSAAGMEMLTAFWDAALAVGAAVPAKGRLLRFGHPGQIAGFLDAAGLSDVREATLTVSSRYAGFAELWRGFEAGIGPAAVFCCSLPQAPREALRVALFERLGSPDGAFTLEATARYAVGETPG